MSAARTVISGGKGKIGTDGDRKKKGGDGPLFFVAWLLNIECDS